MLPPPSQSLPRSFGFCRHAAQLTTHSPLCHSTVNDVIVHESACALSENLRHVRTYGPKHTHAVYIGVVYVPDSVLPSYCCTLERCVTDIHTHTHSGVPALRCFAASSGRLSDAASQSAPAPNNIITLVVFRALRLKCAMFFFIFERMRHVTGICETACACSASSASICERLANRSRNDGASVNIIAS